jgi:hypothetical protein
VNCISRMFVAHNYQGGCSRCGTTEGLFLPDVARGGLMCQMCAVVAKQSGENPYEGVPLRDTGPPATSSVPNAVASPPCGEELG